MASVQPVNAAIRVIELLQAMNRQPVCSIHWLYQATGMPKPTIVRLMQTLEEILDRSATEKRPTHQIADAIAEARIRAAADQKAEARKAA